MREALVRLTLQLACFDPERADKAKCGEHDHGQALVADEFSRASTYTQPRTITLERVEAGVGSQTGSQAEDVIDAEFKEEK